MGLGSGDLSPRHWQQGLSTTRQVTNLVSLSRYKQEILRLRKLVGRPLESGSDTFRQAPAPKDLQPLTGQQANLELNSS